MRKKRITEDYVSFETAKLLKEKGFDEMVEYAYGITESHPKGDGLLCMGNRNSDNVGCAYSRPTLQRAMKWLRTEHNLVIQVELIDYLEHGEVWLYSVLERKTIKMLTGKGEDFTEHSYEEACEAAIKYCLEHLI